MPPIINYILILLKGFLLLLLILAFLYQLSIHSYNVIVRGEDLSNFNLFLMVATYYLSIKLQN